MSTPSVSQGMSLKPHAMPSSRACSRFASAREEFEGWRDDYDGEVTMAGHEDVDRVVWHAGPDGEAVAATFQNEEEAAIATLRRQAFGRLYRDIV